MSMAQKDLEAMAKYVDKIKRQAKDNPTQAKIDADKALYESGVIDAKGVIKSPIVTAYQDTDE